MQLTKQNLKNISPESGVVIPDDKIFSLPEKVLQFGTGVLLRGLPDYFIDKANRRGIFNGRIVVVKSTSAGGADAFSTQDGLYTLCIRGIEEGKKVEETIIHSSISRVIAANHNWQAIMECAYNPEMQLIISNTTEVGITLTEDDIRLFPPHSFPGKLLAFLHERYKAFQGSKESGMVIIPTELITDNGKKLRSIVIELAKMNRLSDAFIQWLTDENHFCNSLVDRIVPGKLPEKEKTEIEKKLGYTDDLMIMAESFRLWAIESGSDRVREILSFSRVDEGVVIAPDIEIFRELKLRLLNGTHTFSCGLAFLAGFKTVKEAMNNPQFYSFVHELIFQEIATAVAGDKISYADAGNFAGKVLDRFLNPYMEHPWIHICVQYSSKMKLRNIPLLLNYYEKTNQPPELMALGFAAFLLFMKGGKNEKGQFIGKANGEEYVLQDDHASYFAGKWNAGDVVDAVLSDTVFWGADLSKLNGFGELVKSNVQSLLNIGAMATLRQLQLHKTTTV
jgi:tagaturonate reductase